MKIEVLEVSYQYVAVGKFTTSAGAPGTFTEGQHYNVDVAGQGTREAKLTISFTGTTKEITGGNEDAAVHVIIKVKTIARFSDGSEIARP